MVEQFLSNFQIIGSSIKSFRIKNDFVEIEDISKMKRKMDVSHSIFGADALRDETVYSGIVSMNIKVTVSEKKLKYQVELQIEGCFIAGKDTMDENQFVNMLRINGLSSLYSIARGFIHGTTSQTLVNGSVLLPMLNIVEYSKEVGSAADAEK